MRLKNKYVNRLVVRYVGLAARMRTLQRKRLTRS